MLSGAVLEFGIADILVESESVVLAGAVVEVQFGVFGEILVEVVTHSEVWAVMLVGVGNEVHSEVEVGMLMGVLV